ncbi:26S proteasome regulatory subunit N1 [Pancytospora philotis]|nr:26S proteasome regulatory subunit N1 [Pancytospora philotis]
MEADLSTIIARLRESDPEMQRMALELLHKEIKSTQGKVAAKTQELLDAETEIRRCLEVVEGDNKSYLHDLLSAMCVLDDSIECLQHRLCGNVTALSEWGHQYVLKLVSNILDVETGKEAAVEYEVLVEPIVRFLVGCNSEVEAIDFLIEVSRAPPVCTNAVVRFAQLIKSITASEESAEKEGASPVQSAPARPARMQYFDLLVELADDDNRQRIILYLEELSRFYELTDLVLRIKAYDPSQCLVALIRSGRIEEAKAYARGMEDPQMKQQLLYILARNSIYYRGDDDEERILSNGHMHEVFSGVASALEVEQPKKLEYMFKGLNKDRIDVLAMANAFVHFAYCRDPVFFPQDGDFKIKKEYCEQLRINKSIATVASAGLISAFNLPFIYGAYAEQISNQPDIATVLALALASCRQRDADGSILNLLSIFVHSGDSREILAALLGIAVLYTGTGDQEIYDLVFPLLSIADNNVGHFAIYVLGAVFPGDMEILASCLDVYEQLCKETPFSNFAILGLSLFFYNLRLDVAVDDALGSSTVDAQATDASAAASDSVGAGLFKRLDRHAQVLALGFMHIGSSNVSVVDKILSMSFVGEIDALLESLGLIASCIVCMGDSMSSHLLERISTSSLLLDSPHLKNIVPICLGILNPSNPKVDVVDILERSVNSGEASINSLIGLGLVGAGSCSSRVLKILDSNFCNVYNDSKASLALIVAQGLVNLGKGLFTLSPLCYDNQLILHKSAASLISTVFVFLESGMLKEHPYLMYLITGAISPKYVSGYEGIVRVGTPAETVGLVGKPNRISASIVHNLPIVLNSCERAEAEDPICTAYVEDVLVKKNK